MPEKSWLARQWAGADAKYVITMAIFTILITIVIFPILVTMVTFPIVITQVFQAPPDPRQPHPHGDFA